MRYTSQATARPADYVAAPTTAWDALTERDTALEFLAMGLRPVSGLSLNRYRTLFMLSDLPANLASLKEAELVEIDDDTLYLTPRGRLLADYIAGQLV